MSARLAVLLAAVTASACGAVPPASAAFAEVEALTAGRVPGRLLWRSGPEDPEVEREVRELLSAPLTADASVRLALLENRRLQATYEELGVAQADLVQAGLLRNPVLAGSVRFPDGSSSRSNLELGLVQDFLDVFMRSARVSIAETQLEEVQLAVAAEVVALVSEVREAYYEALGAEQVSSLRRLVVDAAAASAELARRLHEAGNISDLQLTSELGQYESTRVAWARAEAERLAARERLTRTMGVSGWRADWTLPPRGLPELPAEELPLEGLEAMAIERRLDLAAARRESEVMARALGVTRDWRFLVVADVGVSAERETDGEWLVGPEAALELPLFDQRQAELARLAAELRRADHRVFALAVEIRSEVRAARDRLVARRYLVEHYRDVVIPVREAAVRFTQQEFDYMLVGAFELILAKQAEYDAYQEYVEAVRDYWVASAELERAVGGLSGASAHGLPSDSQAMQEEEETGQAPEHDGHHQHGGH